MPNLYYNTTSPLLLDILRESMDTDELASFRLVGGTALTLQRGHRLSDDIDLFTDAQYKSIDFERIERWFKSKFRYVQSSGSLPVGLGKPFFIGVSDMNCIKVDLYYTDAFINEHIEIDGIRFATLDEIIAMKVDVIARGGRKKDFWDIHELLEDYSLERMLQLHSSRYPYTHSPDLLRTKFTDFTLADDDFNPRCLKGKHWELIKLDLIELVAGL